MHIGIQFIAMCTAYDFTDLGCITDLNLNPTGGKKKSNVAGIEPESLKRLSLQMSRRTQ